MAATFELGMRINQSKETDKARKTVYTVVNGNPVYLLIRPMLGGYQLLFTYRDRSFSAIHHAGSYGANEGLWEVMYTEDPIGYLTFVEAMAHFYDWLQKVANN